MERLSWDGRTLMYGYTIINEFLPGPERRSRKSGGSLFDLRIRDGQTEYRLYDRALRGMHSADAPFAVEVLALLKFMWVRNWLKGLQEAQ